MSDYDIEVCFGDVDSQVVLAIQVPAGTTVRNAVLASELPALCPVTTFQCLSAASMVKGCPIIIPFTLAIVLKCIAR